MPKAKSKAQQRLFFALARRGKISMGEARKRAKSGKSFKALPARKRKRK
jgi:hypothetical protein